MSEKWSENLRRRMENCQQEVPEELWDELSVKLYGNGGVSGNRHIRRYKWLTYAAVCAGILLSGFGAWLSYYIWDMQFRDNIRLAVVPLVPDMDWVGFTSVADDSLQLKQTVKPLILGKGKKQGVRSLSFHKTDSVGGLNNSIMTETVTPDSGVYSKQETGSGANNRFKQITKNSDSFGHVAFLKKKNFLHRVTFALAASHLPGTSNLSYGGFGDINKGYLKADVSQMHWGESHFNDILLYNNNSNSTPETQVKHYQPLVLGVRVAYQFNERWSLETGLTYNFMRSDLRSGGDSYYYEASQNLHFVGLPITASYTFWSSKRFKTYAGAGVWLEKCVAGDIKTDYYKNEIKVSQQDESVMVDPLQCAVKMDLGIQYAFNRHIGLYLEPGLLYHVQTHDPVETIYKEKPFNFNIEMGVRFSIPD